MSIDYKYVEITRDERTTLEIVGQHNNPALPGGVLNTVVNEFERINGTVTAAGDDVYVPILPPFQKHHKNLITAKHIQPAKAEPVEEPKAEPVEEPKAEAQVTPSIPGAATKKSVPTIEKPQISEKSTRSLSVDERLERRPIHQIGQVKYRKYPYTFSRPNETIEAIIRLYNDMNVSRQVIDKLVVEFSDINREALPPKLGQTVDVPVLLPFCYRHENENKIFTDE